MRLLLVLALLCSAGVAAQSFPHKPVRLISGAPPGTPGDVVARIVAEPLAARLGQPVVVENRAGAINTIALGAVARAQADGHTLGILGMPSTLAPSLLPAMTYDTLRDLAPVRQVSWVSNVLVVRPTSPWTSMSELVAAAKARPGGLTYASGGNGTPAHVAAVLLGLDAGLDLRHVPYKGAVAGVAAVMGEQVDMMIAVAPAVLGQIRAGKLRPLATPAPGRIAALADVPTLVELGYGVDVRDWHGIVAPAGTPQPVIARIDGALSEVLSRSDVRKRLAAAGMEPAESGTETFRALIGSELRRWGRVVNHAGIKAD